MSDKLPPKRALLIHKMPLKSIAAAVALSVSAALITTQLQSTALATTAPAPIQADGIRSAPGSFADLIEQVKPAVVNISVRGKVHHMTPPSMPEFRFPPGSPFEDFFERFFEERGEAAPARKTQALGSGFIIDPSGYIVTNNHVVDGAEEVAVILDDGTRYDAQFRGADPKTDLALLKIDADEPLPFVEFGDSENSRVGDWIVAIGNPFGLGGTATTGIISARGRDIQSGPFDDFIQIDAPINRGNSGGPLFDTQGRVIGVNAAIFSPTGGNVGIGFAIPSNLATSVIHQLKAEGKVVRGWLGVQIQTVTEDIADGLGLEEDQGALVSSVVADSPAERAGIKVGDVILKYGENEVAKMKDLPRLVADTRANDPVKMEIWRAGERLSVDVVIGSMSSNDQVASNDQGADPEMRLGLSLAPLTTDYRLRFRLPEEAEGVLIVDVEQGSPAADKGLRRGDVIKMVGHTRVSHPDDVIQEVKQAAREKQDAILLLVSRGGTERFVAVRFA